MSPVSEFFGWQSLGFERLDCEGVRRTTRRWHWRQILRLILLHEFVLLHHHQQYFFPRIWSKGHIMHTYFLRSHYNNLCMAQMGSVQRSVANSHQIDYPGRATPICSLICRPIKDMPIRTSPLSISPLILLVT